MFVIHQWWGAVVFAGRLQQKNFTRSISELSGNIVWPSVSKPHTTESAGQETKLVQTLSCVQTVSGPANKSVPSSQRKLTPFEPASSDVVNSVNVK